MRTTRNTIPGVEFRIDPLGLNRLSWLKSFFLAQGAKPSNSVIVRRALAHYLEHVEKAMKAEDKIGQEVIRLKAHTDGDRSPWDTPPSFTGQPFSKLLSDRRKHLNQRRMDRLLATDMGPRE
jgi:hypothetical protein